MRFTLVSTIYNESKRLQQTISDLEQQTVKPSEIIITDAGSKDGTWEMLQAWKAQSVIPIILLQEERCNVARGRNLAIAAALYEIIVSTDFGCRFHKEWLSSITAPFADENCRVVGGNYTVLFDELRTNTAKAVFVLSNGYNNFNDKNFLPSSRSISFKKEVWETVGKYNENLTLAGDDTDFALKLIANNTPIVYSSKPYVFWGRHDKLIQYKKESYRYGLGDGENGDSRNRRNVISNGLELVAKTLFCLLFIYAIVYTNYYILLAIFLTTPFAFRSTFRTVKNWVKLKNSNFAILLTALFIEDQLKYNYIKGYFCGFKSKIK